jgi:hypothetical protein
MKSELDQLVDETQLRIEEENEILKQQKVLSERVMRINEAPT